MKNLRLLALFLVGCSASEFSDAKIAAPTVSTNMSRDMPSAVPPQIVLACPRSIPIGAETLVQFVGLGDGIALDKLQHSHFDFGTDCEYDFLSYTYSPRGPNAFTLSLNVRPGVAPATCNLTISPQGLTLPQAFSLVTP